MDEFDRLLPAVEPVAGSWERFLGRPMPLWSLMFVLVLSVIAMIGFGSLVRTAARSGRAGKLALEVATIPRTLRHVFGRSHEFAPFRPYFAGPHERLADGFWLNHAQSFTDPGFVLITVFDEARNRPVIRLLRLSDGRVMREYRPDIATANARSRFTSALIDLKRDRGPERDLMMHPLLMPDGGLLIHDTSPLERYDACGRLLWMVDGIFHHSVERGPDGNIWAAYRYPVSPMPGVSSTFNDEALVEVSPDGHILLRRRVADILDSNQLGSRWRGQPYTDDPFHLNDVQPVMRSGPYWQRGDVFLSLRNMSMLLLYRPSTGKVLWSQSGPWALQHDVSVIDDHRISVFDNHWRFAAPEGEVDGHNRGPVYDFATRRVSLPFDAGFAANDINTRAQGRLTPLPNGDVMVEETERGRLLRMAPDGTLRWRYISADRRMRRFQLRWSRYLDPSTDGPAIQAAVNARCT